MAGVLLYADDHIYSSNRPENSLYNELRKELPVLGVENLGFVEESTKSIGAFKAVILDWQFGNEENFEDIAEEIGLKTSIRQGSTKENETYTFLNENDFYSLIYIFSQQDVENSANGDNLKEKFGDRIRFKLKDESFSRENIETIKTDILNEISEWEETNKNLSVPIRWSEAINFSIQRVFKELSEASDNWLRHIYASADGDGVDPELFVIELMQLLLAEKLVQNEDLIRVISEEGNTDIEVSILGNENHYQKSISKLFSILSYSHLNEQTPIMTGDICLIKDNLYGVIITPECDIRHIKDNNDCEFELLTFSIDNFKTILQKEKSYKKGVDVYEDFKEKRKSTLRSLFNQNDPRLQFLPSLPIDELFDKTAVIDFRTSAQRIKSENLKNLQRPLKINSPFIQQIRQRYIAYIGRVGVPSMPQNVRDWNLK